VNFNHNAAGTACVAGPGRLESVGRGPTPAAGAVEREEEESVLLVLVINKSQG